MNKITALILIGILICGLEKSYGQGYTPGDVASDFRLKNVDGKDVSLSQYSGAKGFILIFSCNHCPYVKKYERRIEELNLKYAKWGYPVIAINSNDSVQYPEDSYQNMRKTAREKKFTFPYLYDASQAVAKKYGALKTPHVYVLEKTSQGLVIRYIGAIDDNVENADLAKKKYVEDAVNALIEGKSVKVKETKAIGCGIKWK